MTEGHGTKAKELFYKGYNCSQAVLCAFADELGLSEETALAISSSFGGGMGRLRQVCGTLSGAFMVLGLYYNGYTVGDNAAKAEHYERVRAVAKAFEEESGSILCAQLLQKSGITPQVGGTPEKRGEDFYVKRRVCVDSVELAARIVENYIISHPKEEKAL